MNVDYKHKYASLKSMRKYRILLIYMCVRRRGKLLKQACSTDTYFVKIKGL